MDVLTNTNTPLLSFNVTLQTATTFKIVEKTEDGVMFSGTGTIDESKASAVINAKDGSETLVLTFANMIKQ
jgi:hypothetical protein